MIDATKTIEATLDTTNTNNMSLTLAFSNGDAMTVRMSDLAPAIAAMCMMHGLKQKLVDAAAISRNPDTGRSATVDDKYNAVKGVLDRLLAGQWNKSRGEGSGTSGGLLFRALCQMYADKTPEAIKAFLDKKTPAEKAALRATPKIAAIIDTLRADKADDIDADELLAGLE